MTSVYYAAHIKEVVSTLDIAEQLEQGFIAYSNRRVVVPPVGEMVFEHPPGDTHIKYGFIKEDDYFVIKIASGFYENYKVNLPSSSGVVLLFSQKTGALISILMDEGYLTNIRTAIAGQIVAKYMAPKNIRCIGVFGTGIQARLQVEYLKTVTNCKKIVVWGRSKASLASYQADMEAKGYCVETTTEADVVTRQSNIIITATPSVTPLINIEQLLVGTHITALGADTPDKQEIDERILQHADVLVADSIEQCLTRGEIHQAMKAGVILKENILELGHVIADPTLGRKTENQLTVADLTGVAVQDIQITKAVYHAIQNSLETQPL
ncbi:MAG: ornithine cyclodeaminase family protein [Marinomonas sp.]